MTIKTWPRLSRFEDADPMFALYQENEKAPIQMVKIGKPPIFFATVNPGMLDVLCEVLHLDRSPELIDSEKSVWDEYAEFSAGPTTKGVMYNRFVLQEKTNEEIKTDPHETR